MSSNSVGACSRYYAAWVTASGTDKQHPHSQLAPLLALTSAQARTLAAPSPFCYLLPPHISPTSPCADAVFPGGRRMAVTGTLLAQSWARPGWQHNQDRKRPKGVAGAAVCPEHTRLKKAPTTSWHGSRSLRSLGWQRGGGRRVVLARTKGETTKATLTNDGGGFSARVS